MATSLSLASSILPSLIGTIGKVDADTLRVMLTYGKGENPLPTYNNALCEFCACILWSLLTPEEQRREKALVRNNKGYGKHSIESAKYFVGRIIAERNRGVMFGNCITLDKCPNGDFPTWQAGLSNSVARHSEQLIRWFTDAEFRGDMSAMLAIADGDYHVAFKGAVSYYLSQEAKRGIAHRIAGYIA